MYTYFIVDRSDEARPRVKIGKSESPEQRLRCLQTGSSTKLQLLMTIRGDWESSYHDMFANARLQGEWFAWSSSATDLVYFVVRGRRRRPDDQLLDLLPSESQGQ